MSDVDGSEGLLSNPESHTFGLPVVGGVGGLLLLRAGALPPESHQDQHPGQRPFNRRLGRPSAIRPLSSSQPLGLADGSVAVKKPLPSIAKSCRKCPASIVHR